MAYIMFAGMDVLGKSSPSNLNFLNSPLLVLSCPNYYWNPNRKCQERCLNLLFQRTIFLIIPLFQKYLNPQVRTNKMVNSVVYHPCPARLASMIHLFILLSTFIYLSRILKFMTLKFIENGLILWIIIHVPILHIKP